MVDYVVLREHVLPVDAMEGLTPDMIPTLRDGVLSPGETFSDGDLEPDFIARMVAKRVACPPEQVGDTIDWFQSEAARIREAREKEAGREDVTDRELDRLDAVAERYDGYAETAIAVANDLGLAIG